MEHTKLAFQVFKKQYKYHLFYRQKDNSLKKNKEIGMKRLHFILAAH